jgi:SNF2 family DNA or RNA helicase
MSALLTYLGTVQKKIPPGLWSRGVELARLGFVRTDTATWNPKNPPAECRFAVLVKDVVKVPQIHLYLDDEDITCSCVRRAEFCEHIAAVVAWIKNPTPITQQTNTQQAPEARSAQIAYVIQAETKEEDPHHPPLLLITRKILGSTQANALAEAPTLDTSLVSRIGAQQTGRLIAKDAALRVQAIDCDLRLDGLLKPGTTSISSQGFFPIARYLRESQQVYINGKPTSIVLETRKPKGELKPGPGLSWELTVHVGPSQQSPVELLASEDGSQQVMRVRRGTSLLPKSRTYTADERAQMVAELPKLQEALDLDVFGEIPEVSDVQPVLNLKLEPIDQDQWSAQVTILYPVQNPALTVYQRNPGKEHALERQAQMEFHLKLNQTQVIETPRALEIKERAQKLKIRLGTLLNHSQTLHATKLAPLVSLSSDGRPEISLGSEDVSLERAWSAFEAGESVVSGGSGRWFALPTAWFSKNRSMLERFLLLRDSRASLLNPEMTEFLKTSIAETNAITEDPNRPTSAAATAIASGHASLHDAIRALDKEPKVPKLEAQLRDYQLHGVKWLLRLKKVGLGALLADDMGLGKTLQAIATLDHKKQTLVVCPTSVLWNWRDQISRFRPELSLGVFWGPNRDWKKVHKSSVIITSYSLLKSEIDTFRKTTWDAVIADESQTLKNPYSQAAQLIKQIPARFRIALSGTPLENRLTDLWSQMDFAVPGILGPKRDAGSLSIPQIQSRIQGFFLRRTKEEVAKELPPKSIMTLTVELTPEEREVYQTVIAAQREELIRALEESSEDAARPRKGVTILEALLRLRQASCHPRLIDPTSMLTSSKVDLLVERLDESAAQGHRALVFSQWTSLLDLIEPELSERGIRFVRLDGSTRDRESVVSEFQAPGGPQVFLLSLKAGGTGLNLTAADEVYFMDPWWNPTTEAQASDRAHRIGQTRPVSIFRLIAKDTIEERVEQVQVQKRTLAQQTLSEEIQAGALDIQELKLLLSETLGL